MRTTTINFPYSHRGETVRIEASGYWRPGSLLARPESSWPEEGECLLKYVTVNGKTVPFDEWADREDLSEREHEDIIDYFFHKLRED